MNLKSLTNVGSFSIASLYGLTSSIVLPFVPERVKESDLSFAALTMKLKQLRGSGRPTVSLLLPPQETAEFRELPPPSSVEVLWMAGRRPARPEWTPSRNYQGDYSYWESEIAKGDSDVS